MWGLAGKSACCEMFLASSTLFGSLSFFSSIFFPPSCSALENNKQPSSSNRCFLEAFSYTLSKRKPPTGRAKNRGLHFSKLVDLLGLFRGSGRLLASDRSFRCAQTVEELEEWVLDEGDLISTSNLEDESWLVGLFFWQCWWVLRPSDGFLITVHVFFWF